MNKRLIKILIGVWAILAVFLIGIMLYGINVGGIDFLSFHIDGDFSSLGSSSVQKTDTQDVSGLDKINLRFSSAEVVLKTTDDSKMSIVEKSNSKLKNNEKFMVSRSGDSIDVYEERFGINTFFFWNIGKRKYIEINIPKSYEKDLNVSLSSGNIKVMSDLNLQDVNFSQSSGETKCESNTITGRNVGIKTTSGNIGLNSVNAKEYNIKDTSGNIRIGSLSGSGSVNDTSGNIKIDSDNVTDNTDIHIVSGNIRVGIVKGTGFKFNGRCVSGNVNTSFGGDYDTKDDHSVSTKVGDGPYKSIDISSVSGNIDAFEAK